MSGDKSEAPPRTRVTSIDQLRACVGRELGVGPWLTIAQDRINAFADATGDHQWIHVDPERCRLAGRGTTIAHGYLTLSLITLLREGMDGVEVAIQSRMGINYGSDKVRFITPVREGNRIRLRTHLLELQPVSPGVWQAKYRHTVEIDGEQKPALVAEALNRIYL